MSTALLSPFPDMKSSLYQNLLNINRNRRIGLTLAEYQLREEDFSSLSPARVEALLRLVTLREAAGRPTLIDHCLQGHAASHTAPSKLERNASEPTSVSPPVEGVSSVGQQKNPNSTRYKTELCRPFEENGYCKYGNKCQFAHGVHELRPLNRHPKYKTDLCRTFHMHGFCPYGPRCHFIHGENPDKLNEINQMKQKAACLSQDREVTGSPPLRQQQQQQQQQPRRASAPSSPHQRPGIPTSCGQSPVPQQTARLLRGNAPPSHPSQGFDGTPSVASPPPPQAVGSPAGLLYPPPSAVSAGHVGSSSRFMFTTLTSQPPPAFPHPCALARPAARIPTPPARMAAAATAAVTPPARTQTLSALTHQQLAPQLQAPEGYRALPPVSGNLGWGELVVPPAPRPRLLQGAGLSGGLPSATPNAAAESFITKEVLMETLGNLFSTPPASRPILSSLERDEEFLCGSPLEISRNLRLPLLGQLTN